MKGHLLSNVVLALFVLAVAVMLLVPLPMALLDILLAVNISFALLLLLVGLYMPNALALLSFPSILLLTTLFRLGLNVASTRLILSQGEAGRIIDAFGSFLIQGEIVVGVIIFIIITVVNFIVIARGAGRVSEVAARFALDALPGKQMAIDADLRSGVIDVAQAEKRRDDLRKESQLYGSMDGAMKFVQGDAVAGLFIIFTNILGGIYLGVQRGLSFSDAIQTYTTLTVGDGLVSQIPALLISICAGIVVTRVSSGQNTTLGADIGTQLFNNPVLMVLTGAVLAVLAALPGVPALPFLLVAVALIVTAYFLRSWRPVEALASGYATGEQGSGIGLLPGPGDTSRLITAESSLVLELGRQLFQLYEQRPDYYNLRWRELQESCLSRDGLRLDDLTIRSGRSLALNNYRFEIGGARAAVGEVKPGSIFVETSPNNAEAFGFDIFQQQTHPLYNYTAVWVPASNDQLKLADAAGMRYLDVIEFIFLELEACLRSTPEELIGISEIQSLLKSHDRQHPGLSEQVLVGNYINPARLAQIFQQLLREGISIRDSRQIFELVAAYCSTYRSSMVINDDFDLNDIVSFIRLRRKRVVINGLISERSSLRAVKLNKEVTNLFGQARFDSNLQKIIMSEEQFERLSSALKGILETVSLRGLQPVSIVVVADIRHKVQSFLSDCGIKMRVVADNELDSDLALDTVGVLGL